MPVPVEVDYMGAFRRSLSEFSIVVQDRPIESAAMSAHTDFDQRIKVGREHSPAESVPASYKQVTEMLNSTGENPSSRVIV